MRNVAFMFVVELVNRFKYFFFVKKETEEILLASRRIIISLFLGIFLRFN